MALKKSRKDHIILRHSQRAAEVRVLKTFGVPLGDALRVPAAVARREIIRRRREIAALERMSTKGKAWLLAS